MYSYLLRYLGITAAVVLLYLNTALWQFSWLSWVVFAVYLWFVAEHYQSIIVERFSFKTGVRSKIFGAFMAVAVSGFIAGAFIVFFRFNELIIALSLIAAGFLGAFLAPYEADQPPVFEPVEADEKVILVEKKSYLIIFLIFAGYGFYSLWAARSYGTVYSPWQILPDYYVYLFFLSILLSGGIIFSKIRFPLILSVLVIQFLLAFSYLPLTHSYFWGADGWRHTAAVERVLSGEAVSIANYSQNSGWLSRLNPGLFSYSQFWGVISMLSRVLSLSSIALISWLVPVLAGILLPLLLYEFGQALNFSRRNSLFFSWFGLFPFSLQMAGAFSLPVGFGFLIFLLAVILLIRRSDKQKKGQLAVIIGIIVFSFLGYGLYAILFSAIFAAMELARRFETRPLKNKFIVPLAVAAVFAVIIPSIELAAGYARFSADINVFSAAKQIIGNFSGYFLASGPQTHVIDAGNIFINQVPSYAFVQNGLTSWRWWIFAFMALFFFAAVIGARKMFVRGSASEKILAAAGAGIFAGYLATRYFMAGEHILSRRLDAVIALFGILFAYIAVKSLIEKKRITAMLAVLIISVCITASYSLGPYSRAMSEDEYRSASYVAAEIANWEKPCVVADTYPLLALEALSRKQVVGGGFPIDENFGQPELRNLYLALSVSSTLESWQKAKDLTGAKNCFLIVPDSASRIELPIMKFGGVSIYRQ